MKANQTQNFVLIIVAFLLAIISIAGIPINSNAASQDEGATPGEIIPTGTTKDEIDSSQTAELKTASGDSLRIDNLERPFTGTDMVYHPEADIVSVTIAQDEEFYYFSIELSGKDKDAGYSSTHYGIEFDTDLDLRGEFLLWVKGGKDVQWNTTDVEVYKDGNGDVGGAIPVIPDASAGDGYETLVFPGAGQQSGDSAWQRISSDQANTIQLAIRKDQLDGKYFYWKAWADGGVSDPALFDYNDSFNSAEAGSPDLTSSEYPVKKLNLVDSTCWVPFNFQPNSEKTGSCYKAPAKVKPKSRRVPAPN